MLIQNATISHVSFKSSTSISPIFLIPILSLSSSTNFYYEKMYASYSFSQFINAQKFNLLMVKNSVFLNFLSNVMKVDRNLLEWNPAFTFCPAPQVSDKSVKLVGCKYGDIYSVPLFIQDSRLSVFYCNFINCYSDHSGGGIYHENGYFRTDSNNFKGCQSQQYGGGFYHKTGVVYIYRCSFYGNIAVDGGSQLCVDNCNPYLVLDFCFLTNVTNKNGTSRLILVNPTEGENDPSKIFINPQHSSFNFTHDELIEYVKPYNLMLLGFNCDFSNETFFPGTFDMRIRPSETFFPTPQFSASEDFTETSYFTYSYVFSRSLIFSDSFQFTQSNNFDATGTFTPSNGFSGSSSFTQSINFSASTGFTVSSIFTHSSHFTKSNNFTASNGFTPSMPFTGSSSFTPSRSGTPSYSPIPTRSRGKEPTASSKFSPSSSFTASSMFTPSFDLFSPSEPFGSGIDRIAATKKPLKGSGIMITLIVFGALLLLLGLIANIILCVQMVQAGEIIITQQM